MMRLNRVIRIPVKMMENVYRMEMWTVANALAILLDGNEEWDMKINKIPNTKFDKRDYVIS